MRREQLLRFVESDMSAAEWMRLNKMSPSTFYRWMNQFREEEPEAFGPAPAPGGWLELRRSAARESSALAAAALSAGPAAHGAPAPAALRIRLGACELTVPAGFPEASLASALRAAASL